MTTQRASGSSWRTVVAVLLIAFGATALHRADRDPIENYTQAIIADVIAVALFISEYRRKRRAKLIESRPSAPTAREVEHHEEQQAAKPPATPAAGSVENELRSLAALKADGILSEEEFTAKKRALLGLSPPNA